MKAILIDPFKRSVEAVDIDPTLDNLYETLDVETITVVRLNPDHALILDDEGLLKDKDAQEYFWWRGSEQPFAGRGIILGDKYGDNRDATITVDEVASNVAFFDKSNIDPENYLGWTIAAF